MEWLRGKVGEAGLLDSTVAKGKYLSPNATRMRDLLDALAGDRSKYFNLAFELSYAGPVTEPATRRDATAREKLHDAICAAIHPATADGGEKSDGKERRLELANFRGDLEAGFARAVEKRTGKPYTPETILFDVPEPGKDQVKGLQVDRRSKRSLVGRGQRLPRQSLQRADFFELTAVSPITAALADVFSRWARKVRIFMTKNDIAALVIAHPAATV